MQAAWSRCLLQSSLFASRPASRPRSVAKALVPPLEIRYTLLYAIEQQKIRHVFGVFFKIYYKTKR